MAEVMVGGLRLHVQCLGTGPGTVVFLHGLVMDNLSSWYFTVANPVAQRRSALLYDLRGHGRSERPDTGYHLDTLVAELAALLDLEVEGRVHLVGNSFGGLLAIAFALAHPSRCAGLVLTDALLPEPGWGASMARTLALEGRAREERIAASFVKWLGRHSQRKRNRLATQARALVEDTSLVSDIAASRSYEDAAYEAIACPVLALYGAESDVLGQGERLAARVPQCTLEVFPGCSHSVLWEETARMRARIVGWLEPESG
ncbi:MAG: alpha/beta hydrolase [Deltaproteobacteria bacterium]|nr:alpha/beta hydrolase [Deltaproteobacteria bacterium]MBW2256148.1 alpha/beta hydrolase [Deltaproteobacteria bacterium]